MISTHSVLRPPFAGGLFSPMPPIVDIRRLNFAYPGGPLVLAGLDFVMERSETVAIVGPNGAGKSTLLLHLNGVLPDEKPSDRAGENGIWIDGKRIQPDRLAEIRQQVGLVFQDPDDQLFCPTVWEDVLFGPRHLGLTEEESRRRGQWAINAVGLTGMEELAPHQLSVGQRKRACMAGVLACEPKLLVLDEPTSHLDPRGRREFIQLLNSIDCPKLIATHDLDLVLEVATRVVILEAGRTHADGTPHEILSDPALMDTHGLEVPRSLTLDVESPRRPIK